MAQVVINGITIEKRPPVPLSSAEHKEYYGDASSGNPYQLPPGRVPLLVINRMCEQGSRLRAVANLLEYVLTVLEDGGREFMFYPGVDEDEPFYSLKSEEDHQREKEQNTHESWRERIARIEPLLNYPDKVKWALEVRNDIVHGYEHPWSPLDAENASKLILDAIRELIAYLPRQMAYSIHRPPSLLQVYCPGGPRPGPCREDWAEHHLLPYGVEPIPMIEGRTESLPDQLAMASALLEYVLRRIDKERFPNLYDEPIEKSTIEQRPEDSLSVLYERNQDLIQEQEQRRIYFALGARNDLVHAETKRARAGHLRTFPSDRQIWDATRSLLEATEELCDHLPPEIAREIRQSYRWWQNETNLIMAVIGAGVLLFGILSFVALWSSDF